MKPLMMHLELLASRSCIFIAGGGNRGKQPVGVGKRVKKTTYNRFTMEQRSYLREHQADVSGQEAVFLFRGTVIVSLPDRLLYIPFSKMWSMVKHEY